MTAGFQSDFLWGAATSAYQIEGAPDADGRGPSIWDVFARIPGKTDNGDTGCVACDHYHRYAEDVELMKALNLDAYRFSISWPRIMPTGRGAINERGLDFYDRLVDRLNDAGIEPFATLYHWDLPVALQFELGGWIHDDLPKLFADYAAAVYDRLGDRVRYWLTINEPWCVTDGGYMCGVHAPGVQDETLAYRVAHNVIRAHGHAVGAYRASRYGNGEISFALNLNYVYPATDSAADCAAVQRALESAGGWYTDPLVHGDYPAVMRERLGDLLPRFSAEDQSLLRNSMDYIALNYYNSDTVRHQDGAGRFDLVRAPDPQYAVTEMGWPVVPAGLTAILQWLNDRYPGHKFYITENGAAFDDKPDAAGFVYDPRRVSFLREHIAAVRKAMAAGVDIRGYFAWSLMDNFEWSLGYSKRFGIVRCDYETQQRTIKASGRWYARFIETGDLDAEPLEQEEVSP